MERPPTLSPRLPVAPTGVPIDLRAFKDDHRGDNQCHPGNLDYYTTVTDRGVAAEMAQVADPPGVARTGCFGSRSGYGGLQGSYAAAMVDL